MKVILYIKPEDVMYFLEVVKVLSEMEDVDNDYVFNPKDIAYSEATISNWTQVILDVEDYIMFKLCYSRLS